ncbi:MAG: signal peptidase I, partial [Gammaproteobacteria bacterium]
MLVFRSAIADWNQVPSGSMQPTILIGDRIVVDKLAYDLRIPFTLRRLARWHDPERGDVVTFPSPKDEQLLVKRIVGIPGDVVSLQDNVLTINGEKARYRTLEGEAVPPGAIAGPYPFRFLSESILGSNRMIMLEPGDLVSGVTSFGPVTVPEGQYLML